jgi:hypothetical protein
MPMIESTEMVVRLEVEVDGHVLRYVTKPRRLQGARYHGADPREHGYSTDNSLEAKVRSTLADLVGQVSADAGRDTARLYPKAGDQR